MSVISALKFNINTFLNSTGFQQFKANLKQSMSLSQKFQAVTSSSLGQLAIGYFAISNLVGQYNKAVEASNYQIEQEAKLYNTLRAQKFRDEQIKSIIDLKYSSTKSSSSFLEISKTFSKYLLSIKNSIFSGSLVSSKVLYA